MAGGFRLHAAMEVLSYMEAFLVFILYLCSLVCQVRTVGGYLEFCTSVDRSFERA
jgi:hypothetical protein